MFTKTLSIVALSSLMALSAHAQRRGSHRPAPRPHSGGGVANCPPGAVCRTNSGPGFGTRPAPRPAAPIPGRPGINPRFSVHFGGFSEYDEMSYTRKDAYLDLLREENSDEQAFANYELVLSVRRQYRESLKELTMAFIDIQRALGGANATDNARKAFNVMASKLNKEDLSEVKEAMLTLIRIENNLDQSISAFELMDEASKGRRKSYIDGARSYSRLLTACGGKNFTESAMAIAKLTYSYVGAFSLEALTQTAVRMIKIENNNAQAQENLALVLQAASKYGKLESVAYDFEQMLYAAGGANATDKAQRRFRATYRVGTSVRGHGGGQRGHGGNHRR